MGAISLRLDREAEEALAFLMRDGKSRSEAIRDALVTAARQQLVEQAAADAARVAADPEDVREVATVRALMEALRAER